MFHDVDRFPSKEAELSSRVNPSVLALICSIDGKIDFKMGRGELMNLCNNRDSKLRN